MHNPIISSFSKFPCRRHKRRKKKKEERNYLCGFALTDEFIHEHEWQVGDLLLACSDGLYDMVSDQLIQDILCREASLERRTEDLVEAALAGGGSDNVSIILIQ